MQKLLSEIQFLCSIHLDTHTANTTVNTCLPGVGIFHTAPESALIMGITSLKIKVDHYQTQNQTKLSRNLHNLVCENDPLLVIFHRIEEVREL